MTTITLPSELLHIILQSGTPLCFVAQAYKSSFTRYLATTYGDWNKFYKYAIRAAISSQDAPGLWYMAQHSSFLDNGRSCTSVDLNLEDALHLFADTVKFTGVFKAYRLLRRISYYLSGLGAVKVLTRYILT